MIVSIQALATTSDATGRKYTSSDIRPAGPRGTNYAERASHAARTVPQCISTVSSNRHA